MKKLIIILMSLILTPALPSCHAKASEPANETEIPTTAESKVSQGFLYGDADGDGKITVSDATAIQKVLAGISFPSFDKKAALVSGRNELTINEATLIQRFLAEMITVFPAEDIAVQKDLQMIIGDTPVSVEWEDNKAVDALREAAAKEPLTIQMSMYGGFEQVGSLGMSLPSDDKRITTQAGDIVLYSGNQMVVFYGSNTWAYTRLGHITGKTQKELKELLSNGDVVITLLLE